MTEHASKASASYFSKFGGLWIDRSDFAEMLQAKLEASALDAREAGDLRFFAENGYIIFPGAVDPYLCDDYADAFDKIWTNPPPNLWVNESGEVKLHDADQVNRIVKVADFHYYYDNAAGIVYPKRVLRFLHLLYEKAPAIFQSMTVRKGTQEPLHTDTGPLSLTDPMSLVASWLALEDIRPGTGELQYVPKSHRVPEQLVNGETKAHNGDFAGYHTVLENMKRLCRERNYAVETFIAKKGDILLWSADLLHGGMPIENMELTRKSIICHFMPHGVKPTFYDASAVNYLKYECDGYYLDRFNPQDVADYQTGSSGLHSTLRKVKLGLRKLLNG